MAEHQNDLEKYENEAEVRDLLRLLKTAKPQEDLKAPVDFHRKVLEKVAQLPARGTEVDNPVGEPRFRRFPKVPFSLSGILKKGIARFGHLGPSPVPEPDETHNLFICTHCGKPLPGDKRFCAYCGTPARTSSDAIPCPACGEAMPIGTVFCGACGMSLRVAALVASGTEAFSALAGPGAPPPDSWHGLRFWGGAVTAAVAVLSGGILIGKNLPGEPGRPTETLPAQGLTPPPPATVPMPGAPKAGAVPPVESVPQVNNDLEGVSGSRLATRTPSDEGALRRAPGAGAAGVRTPPALGEAKGILPDKPAAPAPPTKPLADVKDQAGVREAARGAVPGADDGKQLEPARQGPMTQPGAGANARPGLPEVSAGTATIAPAVGKTVVPTPPGTVPQSPGSAVVKAPLPKPPASFLLGRHKIIATGPVPIHKEPREKGETVGTTQPGKVVNVVGVRGLWVEIRSQKGKSGYIPRSAVSDDLVTGGGRNPASGDMLAN